MPNILIHINCTSVYLVLAWQLVVEAVITNTILNTIKLLFWTRIFFTYKHLPVKAVVDVVVSVITSASGGAAILPGLALDVWDSFVHTESYKYNANIVIQKSLVGKGKNL